MHFYTAIIHNKLSSDYPMTGADRHEGHLTSRFASLLRCRVHFVQAAAANSEKRHLFSPFIIKVICAKLDMRQIGMHIRSIGVHI